MNYDVFFAILAFTLTGTILAGVPLLAWAGYRLGSRRLSGESPMRGISAIEGATFALLGLLIAFTFGNANSRLNARRGLIVDETNAIGTAYLRLDCLPPGSRESLKPKFRQYVDARLEFWQRANQRQAASENLERTARLQKEIWGDVIKAGDGNPALQSLVLPGLNTMFDLATTRLSTILAHPPPLIFILLVLLALISSGMAGFGQAGGPLNWYYVGTFAAVIALSLYVILDMEYPRFGLITLHDAYGFMENLRASMGS